MSSDPHTAPQSAPQNIYDDASFFEGYRTLRQGDTGLNGALESPAMKRLLPNLAGLHVLDLGCGFGDFARYARAHGAASVTAVDVSSRMLEEARARTDDGAVTYLQRSIETYHAATRAFDLVVSSLTLHYVEDYAGVVARIYDALRSNGRFVFSVEHPICTAYLHGWVRGDDGHKQHWPVDRYRQEGRRDTRWFVDGVVKYHRTVETYVNTLLKAGFTLTHLGEPAPVPDALAVRPDLEAECRRPPVLFLAAVRAGN
ncbi:class I SAM-dependent methyltransferase [Burkholderia pseudomallei]|uniref:class I SAM-dependent methyltransferase n=1 Tax=Burkholderia pseudomallei TaxID=28450 RepID=UPI00016AB66E|nr:class I SAM-dependent methyltransferase [Burkholderia pseudomallei]MPT62351.1 class I SAM-dependent methyltransferase [Burkholderia pseudomallei]MPT72660.1 class I SAM-dependent methyltransferase [Burkholderia pseudomallei]MPT74772.1 class I SAM-dependent methyltransferase [Burkholderia pseudomallei]MPT82481.1 class I SAM-dependent methyltransferase [Burkholderia pseudomallei]MPT93862.1 class I SAM-dependent methyltransferase [Burkholderia pseudomallei]